ncbi:protein ALTERED XYLOGLUCAN 4 [Zea mays]|uniref:Putative DUF231 domain containing family protein n=1 Tax=Zea mays TaxID=4577 RepID=K7VCW9_MAIZE|nr:protein ALTERED XYLOGLUCAN 4 [Zea mays]AQL00886.1 Putative DUF231 domain containing family protein [Zea mays]|eukprot:XP_008659078.1 protein ALTERED XYLOGLUCAN 4 [Zea mays]
MGAHEPLHPHKQMRTSSSSSKGGYFVPRSVCAWLVCGFVALALLHVLCCTPPGTQEAVLSPLLQYVDDTYNFVSSGPQSCNYTEGRWVYAPGHARRYNGTECHVKDSHDCIRNGRPDTGYLDWRWQPAGCRLPAFSARAFLSAVRGKHVAFVGDSMSRNQAQSLVCLLGAAVPHRVVYRDPDPRKFNLWRWAFPAYDVTVSFYWAPFVARATGKALNDSLPQNMNHVHLDALDDRWAADADTMDVVVFSIAHWPLNGAIYYNGSARIGHHGHQELSPEEDIGYAWPMKVAYRMALDRLVSGAGADGGRARTVVIATFSPGHFEGNTLTTMCPRKEPYKEGEKEPRHLDMELVGLVYEEVEAARARHGGGASRVEVLDVTKLAVMRPDGHPGLYMHRDPFAHGGPQPWMSSDCVHFCLPGPVDTFNEILQQIIRKKG